MAVSSAEVVRTAIRNRYLVSFLGTIVLIFIIAGRYYYYNPLIIWYTISRIYRIFGKIKFTGLDKT